MEVPKSTETRCRDSRIAKLNIHSPSPTSFSHVTACSTVALIYSAGVAFHTDSIHSPCNKLKLFMLQLTCEKDVGLGLCMFNFAILLSLHLVSVLFGTSIPTSVYIFGKCFFALGSVHFFLIK